MDGFNPSWIIALAIGILLVGADFMMPEDKKKRFGKLLLVVGALLLLVGAVGIVYDGYTRFFGPIDRNKTGSPPSNINVLGDCNAANTGNGSTTKTTCAENPPTRDRK